MHHEIAWALDDVTPPVFEHSPNGTCVVIGSKEKVQTPPDLSVEIWSGNFETATITDGKCPLNPKPSYYMDFVERGCFFGPFHYFTVDEVKKKSRSAWMIRTQIGTKGQWKGKSHEGKVEREALLPLVSSKDLDPPFCHRNQYLIAPLKDGLVLLPSPERKQLFPHTDAFWRKCNKEFRRESAEGATEILETNYGFPASLAKQLAYTRRGKVKVVYNSSGSILKAARISSKIIVNSNCYWIICRSVKEAQYLVGVINAPNMQSIWVGTKTSKLHFHMSPLKTIPVPEFNPEKKLHIQLAKTVSKLEEGELYDLDCLNKYTLKLLPHYVN